MKLPVWILVIARSGSVPSVTVKLLELVAVPPSVLTEIGPVVAPAGTMAVSWLVAVIVYDALVPLNVTLVVESRFEPVTVTPVSAMPLAGEKLMEPGAAGVWPSTLLRSTQARLFGKALKKL